MVAGGIPQSAERRGAVIIGGLALAVSSAAAIGIYVRALRHAAALRRAAATLREYAAGIHEPEAVATLVALAREIDGNWP
jgi:hypothetical protein